VGFGPDPTREAELVERIGIEIRLHRCIVEHAVVVVGRE